VSLILPVGKAPPQVESQHWYDREGRPCYEQATGKGGLRPTDLRDARKLGLVPSVTTVLSVLAKPALTTWLVDQAILAALTLPRVEGETESAYIQRIREDSKAQAKAAADEGTKIHDAIEAYFKGGYVPLKYAMHVEAVAWKLREVYPGVTDWIAEKSFAHSMGYGGKVDLHSPSTGIVVDHKGKDGDFSDGKKLAYDQHWQLAPYNRGLLLPPSECMNLFVSRTHPGKVAHHVWTQKDVDEGWRVFCAALETWKCLRRFDSAFALQAA